MEDARNHKASWCCLNCSLGTLGSVKSFCSCRCYEFSFFQGVSVCKVIVGLSRESNMMIRLLWDNESCAKTCLPGTWYKMGTCKVVKGAKHSLGNFCTVLIQFSFFCYFWFVIDA